jgi:tetratricopeptide (TPR) repeat protein
MSTRRSTRPAARTDAARRERRSARKPEAAPLPAAPEPDASRAAIVLALGLAGLALLRAWATLAPGMGAWGVNHARFLAPLFGWPLWALAALALLPWIARPITPAFVRLGDMLADWPRLGATLAALAAAAFVLAFPDRLRFVGDFLLRQGTVEEAGRPGLLFPQALPLDVWLHVTLPTLLLHLGWLDANGAARAIGAIEAALLAVFTVALVRVLRLRGAAAIAVAATVWGSGALTMYTGYSKAFGELSLLTVAAAVFALDSHRRATVPLGLGVVLAIGLVLHRSAVGFALVWIVAWVLWALRPDRAGDWKRPLTWLALVIPLSALVLLLPKIVATFLKWDAVHLTPAEVRQPQDLANLLMVLAPAVPALLAAGLVLGRGWPRRRELVLLLALVLPLAGVIPFIHPAQGLFRDWDDFTAAGAALAVLGAWIAGEILRGAPRFAWLAPAIALGSLVPAFQWVAVQSDLARGLARVDALVEGPPKREGPEWGNTWDYLGIRNFRLQRWDVSAEAFAHAAETSPSPRILRQWAFAESNRGDHAAAQRIFREMAKRNPDDYLGWSGLAQESSRLSDAPASREAAYQMLRLRPRDRDALILLQSIDDWEKQHPAGVTAP